MCTDAIRLIAFLLVCVLSFDAGTANALCGFRTPPPFQNQVNPQLFSHQTIIPSIQLALQTMWGGRVGLFRGAAPVTNDTELIATGDSGSEYAERLVADVDDPQKVFDAILRNLQHFKSPAGSDVTLVNTDGPLDRVASFYVANFMLAFINQRKKKYGVGWVSLLRNYGKTVKGQLELWKSDEAFKEFPWENFIGMAGDNYIHGFPSKYENPGPSGIAEADFYPFFNGVRRIRKENTLVVPGNFSDLEAKVSFLAGLHLLPRRLRRAITYTARRAFPMDQRTRYSPRAQEWLVASEFKIMDFIEDTYPHFIQKRVKALAEEAKAQNSAVDVEGALREASLDIMHFGLPKGPEEEPYYRLVALGHRFPILRPFLARWAGRDASVHVFFNEKGWSPKGSRMRVVPINDATKRVNGAKYKQEKLYSWAITIGLRDVREMARYNIVFANTGKGTALHLILYGFFSLLVPAAVLQCSERVAKKTRFFVSRATGLRTQKGVPLPPSTVSTLIDGNPGSALRPGDLENPGASIPEKTAPEPKTFVAVTWPGVEVTWKARQNLDEAVKKVIKDQVGNGQFLFEGGSAEPLERQSKNRYAIRRAKNAFALLGDLALEISQDPTNRLDAERMGKYYFSDDRHKVRIGLSIADFDPALFVDSLDYRIHLIGSSGRQFALKNLLANNGSHYFKLSLIEFAIPVLGSDKGREFLKTLLRHEARMLEGGTFEMGEESKILNDGYRAIWAYTQTGIAKDADPATRDHLYTQFLIDRQILPFTSLGLDEALQVESTFSAFMHYAPFSEEWAVAKTQAKKKLGWLAERLGTEQFALVLNAASRPFERWDRPFSPMAQRLSEMVQPAAVKHKDIVSELFDIAAWLRLQWDSLPEAGRAVDRVLRKLGVTEAVDRADFLSRAA